jgi:hypothetical protein
MVWPLEFVVITAPCSPGIEEFVRVPFVCLLKRSWLPSGKIRLIAAALLGDPVLSCHAYWIS